MMEILQLLRTKALCKKRWLMTFVALIITACIIAFFRFIAFSSYYWIKLGAVFLGIFLSFCVLMPLGILFHQARRRENEEKDWKILPLLKQCFPICLSSLYLTLPVVVFFFLAWIILGVILFVSQVSLFAVIIAFSTIPFLLVFAMVLLVVFCIMLLFFAPGFFPIQNLRKLQKLWPYVIENFKKNYKQFVLSLVFLILVSIPVLLAFYLTQIFYLHHLHPAFIALEWFFMLLPVSLIYTPCVIIFFEMGNSNLKQKKGKVS